VQVTKVRRVAVYQRTSFHRLAKMFEFNFFSEKINNNNKNNNNNNNNNNLR